MEGEYDEGIAFGRLKVRLAELASDKYKEPFDNGDVLWQAILDDIRMYIFNLGDQEKAFKTLDGLIDKVQSLQELNIPRELPDNYGLAKTNRDQELLALQKKTRAELSTYYEGLTTLKKFNNNIDPSQNIFRNRYQWKRSKRALEELLIALSTTGCIVTKDVEKVDNFAQFVLDIYEFFNVDSQSQKDKNIRHSQKVKNIIDEKSEILTGRNDPAKFLRTLLNDLNLDEMRSFLQEQIHSLEDSKEKNI